MVKTSEKDREKYKSDDKLKKDVDDDGGGVDGNDDNDGDDDDDRHGHEVDGDEENDEVFEESQSHDFGSNVDLEEYRQRDESNGLLSEFGNDVIVSEREGNFELDLNGHHEGNVLGNGAVVSNRAIKRSEVQSHGFALSQRFNSILHSLGFAQSQQSSEDQAQRLQNDEEVTNVEENEGELSHEVKSDVALRQRASTDTEATNVDRSSRLLRLLGSSRRGGRRESRRRRRAQSALPPDLMKGQMIRLLADDRSRDRTNSGVSNIFSTGRRSTRSSSVFSVDRAVYESLMTVDDEAVGKKPVDVLEPLVEVSREEEPSITEDEIERPSCLICMGKETKTRLFMDLPCQKRCNLAPVHKRCIYEWREQKDGKGTCPLCRSPLTAIDYSPPDALNTLSLSDPKFRKIFMLRPVPKEASMVRTYLKVRHNGFLNSPTEYEFFLQKPCTIKYPGGPLPDATFPQAGDVLLAHARKSARLIRRQNKLLPMPLSILEISLTNYKDSFNQRNSDFLGAVQANNVVGLEYSVKALPVPETAEDGGVDINITTASSNNKTKIHGNSSTDKTSKYSMFSRRRTNQVIRQEPYEVACISYTQNRFGADSGPRKMKVALPGVELENGDKMAKLHSMDDNDFDIDDDDDDYDDTPPMYRTVKLDDQLLLSNAVKNIGEETADRKIFIGKNKEPYWLETLEAYSLDFNGRVTLPSNKNFQIELQSEFNAADDIRLQFGKVAEGQKESIYTIDFQWPLSPMQALGICLSSCDRKIGCA